MKFPKIADPELRAALEGLSEQCEGNLSVASRINDIASAATKRDADMAGLATRLDDLKKELDLRSNELKDLAQKQRVTPIAQGAATKQDGLRLLGMIARGEMVRVFKARGQEPGSDVMALVQREANFVEQYAQQRGMFSGDSRATLQAGASPGSLLVPTVTEAVLYDALEQISQFVYECDFRTGLAANVKLNSRTGRPRLVAGPAMDSEASRVAASFDQITFSPNKAGFLFPVDNMLLMMSAVNLGAEIYRFMMEAAVDGLSYWALWADGTATYNGITGIMRDRTASRVYTLPAGKKSAGDLTATDLQQGKAGLFQRAQNSGSWLMGSWVYSLIQNLDRLGKYPLISTSGAGQESILGNRRMIDTNMTVQAALDDMPWVPADGADQAFMAFGDFKGLLVGLVGGIQMAADTSYLFGQDQTAFRLMMYLDIKPFPGRNYKAFRTAAA